MKNDMPIAGRWNYINHKTPFQFGDIESYKISSEWLNDCDVVEDWGCGCAFAKQFFTTCYIGIDGSITPWCDKVANLMTYKSKPSGLLIRHVLEHNYEWRVILKSAVASFQKRMALVMFIPPSDEDTIITPKICVDPIAGFTVPDISCCKKDIISIISTFLVNTIILENTKEIIYLLEKL